MKYVLTIIAAVALIGNTSAANSKPKLPKSSTLIFQSTEPVVIATEISELQIVLDRLQVESQNTVIYPLVRMSQLAKTKIDSLRKHSKPERIRTNNSKRTVNPNRS